MLKIWIFLYSVFTYKLHITFIISNYYFKTSRVPFSVWQSWCVLRFILFKAIFGEKSRSRLKNTLLPSFFVSLLTLKYPAFNIANRLFTVTKLCTKEVKNVLIFIKLGLSKQRVVTPLNYIKKFISETLSKRKSDFSKIICINFRLSRFLHLHSQYETKYQQFIKLTQITFSSHMRYGFLNGYWQKYFQHIYVPKLTDK
jgi:hypothetical protein